MRRDSQTTVCPGNMVTKIGVVENRPLLRKMSTLKKKLAWGKEQVGWTKAKWNRALSTDESKFESFGSRRRTFVCLLVSWKNVRFCHNCLVPKVKQEGGSIMVWGECAPLEQFN